VAGEFGGKIAFAAASANRIFHSILHYAFLDKLNDRFRRFSSGAFGGENFK